MVEFILDNILVILVALGAISSLFQEGKKKNLDVPTTPSPMEANERETKNTSLFDEMKKTFEKNLPELKTEGKQKVFDEIDETKIVEPKSVEPEPVFDDKSDVAKRPMKTIRKENVQKGTDAPVVPNISKKTIVTGIVWSEILGPPRSKKPYTTNRFQK
ncbi:hypothetical protein [Fervidibacillus albus]|uniref:Uncharacterized protein n=1 Tax=Fervidibacillus albus TaxID=2980026 RepID=A0A9E8LWH1_9BACI|nr:hypothetical protein [Fervidibacillus albus]WAA10376.1 hypothetical protein OE104_03320 [Fervidibacillus albus]